MMSEDYLLILKEQFYDKLYNNLLKNDAQFRGHSSIFLRFLKAKKNPVLDYLDAAAISSDRIDPIILQELIECGYIRLSKEFSKYVMTGNGVWVIENLLNKIDLQILVNEIDDDKYNVKWGGKLSDKEKVVILSLISLRAFYEKTPLNRKNKGNSVSNIHEVMIKSHDFLNKNLSNFYVDLSKERRENKVDTIFARLTDLPEKTHGVYKMGANSRSWLDIYSEKDNLINKENLGYLLWKIFGGDLNLEKQDVINNFCSEILLDHKNYVYNPEEIDHFVFSDIEHQNAINDSLFLIVEKKALWEGTDK